MPTRREDFRGGVLVQGEAFLVELEGCALAREFGGVKMRGVRLFDDDGGCLPTRRSVPDAGNRGSRYVAVASTETLRIPAAEPADAAIPSRAIG